MSKARSKEWLDGYLEGLRAVYLVDNALCYGHLGDRDTLILNLKDAEEEARAAWRAAREVPPTGLAVHPGCERKATENTEKADNNPKEV